MLELSEGWLEEAEVGEFGGGGVSRYMQMEVLWWVSDRNYGRFVFAGCGTSLGGGGEGALTIAAVNTARL